MNTKPSTPFGKFFDKLGVWHPHIEDALKDIYGKLHDTEKTAVKDASGWIAIINTYIKDSPEDVFKLIQLKFPNVTKEGVTDTLNKLNTEILKVDANTPDDFETALTKLQEYLGKYQGNTWVAITRSVVSVLTDIFLKGASPIQTIETVMEYVYQIFVKPHVNA